MSEMYYTKEEVDKLLVTCQQKAVEEALKTLPFAIKHLVSQIGQVQKMKETFQNEHKDLAKHKDLVTRTMEKVEMQNPTMSPAQVLEKTVELARAELSKRPQVSMEVSSRPSNSVLNDSLNNILGAFDARE